MAIQWSRNKRLSVGVLWILIDLLHTLDCVDVNYCLFLFKSFYDNFL